MGSVAKKSVLALLVGMLALPGLLCLSPVQKFILERVAARMGLACRVEGLQLEWAASCPRVTLGSLMLEGPGWRAVVSSAAIYPDLGALMRGGRVMKRIEIEQPELDFFTNGAEGQVDGVPLSLSDCPASLVRVTNGTLRLWSKSRQLFHTVYGFNADLTSQFDNAALSFSCRPSFAGSLGGTVTLEIPADGASEEVWGLAIRAENMPVAPSRAFASALLPGNHVAEKVFSIVTGGKIDTASFRFKGSLSDLLRLEHTQIVLGSRNLSVRVPKTGLTLGQVAGSVAIEDGLLHGDGLVASVGRSRLTGGSLVLGMGSGKDDFRLAVDIEADLSELPWVLLKVPALSGWHGYLRRITRAEGRVAGRLVMGESYGDIRTEVHVGEINGEATCSGLDETVALRQGQIDIFPEAMVWRGLGGTMGPHRILRSKGKVTWAGGTAVSLDGTDLVVDSTAFHSLLKRYPALKGFWPETLLSVAGPVSVEGGWVTGRPDHPGEMQYGATLRTDGLRFHASFLPGPVTVRHGAVEVGQDLLRVNGLHMDAGGRRVSVTGSLAHAGWKDFSGCLELEGYAGRFAADWLKSTGWVPHSLFPRVPFEMSPLRICAANDGVEVSGRTVHGTGALVTLSGNLAADAGSVSVRDGVIETPEERANLDLSCEKGDTTLVRLGFRGALSGGSVLQLLEAGVPDGVTFQRISGDLAAVFAPGDLYSLSLTGTGDISGAGFRLKGGDSLSMGRTSVKGRGETIDFSADRMDYRKVKQKPDGSSASVTCPLTRVEGALTRLSPETVLLSVSSADFYGMDMTAMATLPAGPVRATLKTRNGGRTTFETIYSCLGMGPSKIKGKVVLDAMVAGETGNLNRGRFVLTSSDGTIQGMTLITRILNVLNMTGLFSQKNYQGLFSGGFHYNDLVFRGRLEDGVVVLERSYIYGDGINLFFTGTIDLEKRVVDIVVLAAPLKSIDTLLRHVPFLGSDTGILTIPVSVTGPVESPEVVTLGPGKVADGALNAFKSIFGFPFRILDSLYQTVVPGTK